MTRSSKILGLALRRIFRLNFGTPQSGASIYLNCATKCLKVSARHKYTMKNPGFQSIALVLSLSCAVNAHGYHPKAKDMTPDPDWATMHMAGRPLPTYSQIISLD
jgi:hypothetical protein